MILKTSDQIQFRSPIVIDSLYSGEDLAIRSTRWLDHRPGYNLKRRRLNVLTLFLLERTLLMLEKQTCAIIFNNCKNNEVVGIIC